MIVRYTDAAVVALERVESFLRARFTAREAAAMRKLLAEFEDRVVLAPEMYQRRAGNAEVRQAVLHKRLIVLYVVLESETIAIVDAWDTREDRRS